jgi:hypothetical protein
MSIVRRRRGHPMIHRTLKKLPIGDNIHMDMNTLIPSRWINQCELGTIQWHICNQISIIERNLSLFPDLDVSWKRHGSQEIEWRYVRTQQNNSKCFQFSLKFWMSLGLYGNCFGWSFRQPIWMNSGEFSRKYWREDSKNLGLLAGLIVGAVNSSEYFLKHLIWNRAWPNLMHLQQNMLREKLWVKLIRKTIACYRAKITFPGVSNRCDDSVKAGGVLIPQQFLQNILWIAIFCLRIWIWMYGWSYGLFCLHHDCNSGFQQS